MKTYKVGVYFSQGGFIEVKAKSEDDAEKKALISISDFGVGGVNHEVEVTHRESEIVCSPELIK